MSNIVLDSLIAVMLIINDSNIVIRINAKATVSLIPEFIYRFGVNKKRPRSVIIIHIEEIYFNVLKY